MKRNVLNLIVIGVLSFLTYEAVAQKRGDTDYTNNRGRNKAKRQIVNTDKQTPVKIIEYIPGTWKFEAVYKGKKDITATDTLAQIQSLEFDREGRFVSYSTNEKIDSGAYRINEQHAVLYLTNEDDKRTDEWYVRFGKDNTMTLTMKDVHGGLFKYVYRRDGTTTTSNK